ncbi:MAG: tRNA (cytidine(34)-2'-O)-methyltransferase [Alphaproteobacteria bacterium]
MQIALYQPDIPQNTGTILRMAACFDIGVNIIEPCGFVMNNPKLRRSGMDYLDQVSLTRHASWNKFIEKISTTGQRLVLLTTKTEDPYTDFHFKENDILLLGRESAGVPDAVHNAIPDKVTIPMHPDCRSLNIAVATAMVLGEALRQTNAFSY